MKYLDPKYTKSVQNSTVRKKHSFFFLIDKFWHGHLKEDIKIANKHVKSSKSFVIKELKMKTRHYIY